MRNNKRKKARHELLVDFVCIFIGAGIAIYLSNIGIVDLIIQYFSNTVVASFITGLFFTSIFTISPASVVFGHIVQESAPMTVALWGALGATFGDLILFFFIRDRFTDDLMNSIKPSITRHIFKSFHLGFMKWLSPVLGALIIASPLPDELGLTLMGLSKMRVAILIPIAFIMNMLGIYLIVWFGTLL